MLSSTLGCFCVYCHAEQENKISLDGCATWQVSDSEVIVYLGRSLNLNMTARSVRWPWRKQDVSVNSLEIAVTTGNFHSTERVKNGPADFKLKHLYVVIFAYLHTSSVTEPSELSRCVLSILHWQLPFKGPSALIVLDINQMSLSATKIKKLN